MKNTILLLTTTVLLAACGASTPTDDLGRKRHELDSLKTLHAEISERIKEIDAWIAENDSTVKKNLPSVTTIALNPSLFEHFVEVHGNVKADKSAELYTMGGRVERVLVSEGDMVRAGQPLIDLDNDAAAQQLQAAKAGAKLAREVYEKQAILWQQKIGSEVQFLQAEANMKQAEASVNALAEQAKMGMVTAPFSGVVDEIMVSEGDMTSPMAPVARVVDPTGATLEADVPESYLQRVKKDDPVLVVFPSTKDSLRATLSNVSRYINPTNRTFKVSVRVPNGSNAVRPNLLSVIHVRDLVQDSALVVPSRLLQEDVSGNNYVFVLEEKDGRTFTRKVMVQRMADHKGDSWVMPTEAGASLVGATLVDEGAKSVGNGQEVKVTNL